MTHVIHSPSLGNLDLLHETNVKIPKLACPSLHFARRMAILPFVVSAPELPPAGTAESDSPTSAGVVGRPDISFRPLLDGIADIMLECVAMPSQNIGAAIPTSPVSSTTQSDGGRARSPPSRPSKRLPSSNPIVVYDRVDFWPTPKSASSGGGRDRDRAVNVVQPVILNLQPQPANHNQSAAATAASAEPSPDLYVWYSPNVTITAITIGNSTARSHQAPTPSTSTSTSPPAVWSLRNDMDPVGLSILGVQFVREPGSGGGPIRALQFLVHAPPLRPNVRDPNEKVITTSASASLPDGKVMSPGDAVWIGGGFIAAVVFVVAVVLGLARRRRQRRMAGVGKWKVLEEGKVGGAEIEAQGAAVNRGAAGSEESEALDADLL